MLIVNPIKQCRPINSEHREPYEKIERTILGVYDGKSFTESDLAHASNVDKLIVRKCLYRLHHLGALREVARVSKGKGRPSRLWTR
jgi:predicted ArsR family transcriptional regulator